MEYASNLRFFTWLLWASNLNLAISEYSGAYSHDTDQKISLPKWMQFGIGDGVTLSQMSIPGTHDSMANFYDIAGLAVANYAGAQSLGLDLQLQSGIRALDIRCEDDNGALNLHHGVVYLNKNLDDVLGTVTSFLASNPGETIIMRVKQENSQVDGNTFGQHFGSYWTRYATFFWSNTNKEGNPTMKEIRGKIVVLRNFDCNTEICQTYGLKYCSNDDATFSCAVFSQNFAVEDNYSLASNWNLYDKWTAVKSNLVAASQGGSQTTYMTYLSGSGTVVAPYFVASGQAVYNTGSAQLDTGYVCSECFGPESHWSDFPRFSCLDLWVVEFCSIYFQGTNTLTAAWIETNNPPRVGIIMADFPGPDLISEIVLANSGIRQTATMGKGPSCYSVPSQNSNNLVLLNNGWYTLQFQVDGNLVLYNPRKISVWATETYNQTAAQLCFQNDGNLVIYSAAPKKQVLFATNTYPGGATLSLQTDCNLVIYDGNHKALWSPNTYPCK